MRGLLNDCMRRLIGFGIIRLGTAMCIAQRIRIGAYSWNLKRLRRLYGITPDTRILPFGPESELLVEKAAERAGRGARFAFTSGSTGRPKRILYTKGRLRTVRLAFVDAFARCCRSLRIERTSLYVFSSLSKDDSLTSLLLEDERLPPYLFTLQAPYRVQCHAAIRALASEYGVTAVRLWILAIANPGVLYSTNPSTLSYFLDELSSDWRMSSALVRRWVGEPEAFDAKVHEIARRLESRGSGSRLRRIAESRMPLALEVVAPAVKTCICWTGGYVKPFLDRLACRLPRERYRLVPMYSMSTETIETVSRYDKGELSFLPLASRVLYEFIEEGMEDRPENLLTACGLRAGKTYAMVVSDPYGLRRYQTGDLFLCHGFVHGLPDLSFVRRRGLEYSFTGEKLTAEQVGSVFGRLRAEYPILGADKFLCCVPSHPFGDPVPHYKLVLVEGGCSGVDAFGSELAGRCDRLLGEVNGEYAGKRSSGRLGRVEFLRISPGEFAVRLGGSRRGNGWNAQFKFLPLYRRLWESFDEEPSQTLSSAAVKASGEAAQEARRSLRNPDRG